MTLPLTVENGLILACARTDPDVRRIQTLVAAGPDWDEFIRKVECWRVAPLVYASMRQAAEPGQVRTGIIERLRQLCHREATYGILQREVLRAALVRLSEASVPVIVLKSAALAALVYPSPALRPTRSVELLVRERDRDAADALVRGIRHPPGSPAASFSGLRIRDHVDDRAESARRIPIEHIWDRARAVRIESVPTLVSAPEDLLLQLGLDMTTCRPSVDGSVRSLCDIGETCRRYGSAIDWNGVVARAAAYGMADPLYHSLRLARDLVEAAVPPDVLDDLRAGLGRLPRDDPFLAALARPSTPSADRSDDSIRCLGSDGSDAPPADAASRAPRPRGRSSAALGEVALTYDPYTTDGVGSQLLRIYGLYALSRALHVKYVHTPMALVGYQGFLPLLTGRADPEFTARYNGFFSLPSDGFDLDACERVRIHILDGDTVERYRHRATTTGRPVLLQAIHHYGYTDYHPAVFHAVRAVSPYRGHRATGPVRVCIHLRRGDNCVPSRTDVADRLLPDGYYLRVCGVVVNALRAQGARFVVRLHTEVPPRRYTLYPDTPGLYFWLDQPATVDPEDYSLEAFETLPELEMAINVEAREALDDFATADVLILSRSALGYVGGLLNPHGLVVYAPWWHPALPEWLVADEHGNLDAVQVATRIADHLRRR